MQAWVEQGEFSGGLSAQLGLDRGTGEALTHVPSFETVTPNIQRANGWRLLKRTIEIPAGGTCLYPAFEVRISGELLLAAPTLERR